MKKEKKGLFSFLKRKPDPKPAAPAKPEPFQTPTYSRPTPPPPPAPKKPEPKTYKVTGMEHYLDNILTLACTGDHYDLTKKELIEYGLTEERIWQQEFYPGKVELVPEPDNPHDPKAIKVMVDGQHVGYIKKGSCAHLLKVIKEGRLGRIECEMGGGNYKYIEEDYDDERDKYVYNMDRGSAPYFVHLKIEEK